jgi:hypothetical protein
MQPGFCELLETKLNSSVNTAQKSWGVQAAGCAPWKE